MLRRGLLRRTKTLAKEGLVKEGLKHLLRRAC